MADQVEVKCPEENLPPNIKDWDKHHVKQWVLKLDGVDGAVAETLWNQDVNGRSLLILKGSDFSDMDVKFGPAKLIICARDELLQFSKDEPTASTPQPGKVCKPYPFGRHHDTYRYIENNIIDCVESGASDWIEPCHEYKAFHNTTEENEMEKFVYEVIRFGAACMNSRTNGTIHFGIGDVQEGYAHGQILGVVVGNKEAYGKKLKEAIDGYFEYKHKEAAKRCIKPPRFVGVLKRNMTSSDKCVIEVDIHPDSTICEENVYHTNVMATKKYKKKAKETESQPSKQFFVRDGGSTHNLLTPTTEDKHMKRYDRFVHGVAQLSELRKKAEEKQLGVIKRSTQGSRLMDMITGGTLSLDKSHFERYIIVSNKSHSSQLESLGFLVDLEPTAVLDFDPESAKHGLQVHLDQLSTVGIHSPANFKITGGVEEIAKALKLSWKTGWVFCNGRIDHEPPSDIDHWLMDKGASVRDVIAFMCRKEVLPNKRFLVIFLLLSTVDEKMDPLVETLCMFCQELRGTQQILCICDNENAFTSWRDLIEARCGIDISGRCIYHLSFEEVNGTITSLWSKNRRTNRFLPGGGGGKVILEKKAERSLSTIEVLCVNQCEGGNEDKMNIEENFYRGGKVSWWNFYFSEQPGSTSFIKRDRFDHIINTVIPDLCSLKRPCVVLNLMHVPGCGGTTLAKHTLWALRDKFRCAVLRNSNNDLSEVADHVVKLLMNGNEEQLPSVPVLLMIDDFDDMDKVSDLQQLIETECTKKAIQSKFAQVLVLNCMRSDSSELTEQTEDTVFIGNSLSENEQKMFEEKLVEIEKAHKNAATFYGFMIMKSNFKAEYIQSVVHNTLRSFSLNQKPAQLLAVLVLLNVYCKGASLSVSLCEEFLGLQPQPVCGTNKIEDGFGKCSNLIGRCAVEGDVAFTAVKLIHSSIAKQCLHELTTVHNVQKAEIAELLLTTVKLFENTQGKGNLLQDLHYILVKRQLSAEESSQFSPLIQDIARETPGLEEIILENASKIFDKNAIVSQLLARYYYLKKKDFLEAKDWARKAKDLSKDSSFIADTSAQVIKHELKNVIEKNKEETIGPEKLNTCLRLAQGAMDAFKETQSLAKKESLQRLNSKTDNSLINTSGHLGEIEVGTLVIDVLEKIPVFCADSVRHDIMSLVLCGELKLQDVQTNDPRRNKNASYYATLKQFEDVLYNLKYRMKVNFDFLDNFHVNLGSKCGIKYKREQESQRKLFIFFQKYVKVFCQTDSAFILKNKRLSAQIKLHQARQFLEKEKADTFSGILGGLSNGIASKILEKIVRQYKFICDQSPTAKEQINFIYSNIVLSCLKLQSQEIIPYHTLINCVFNVLRDQVQISDNLPLYFIALVLLWPPPYHPECRNLRTYISKLKGCYHTQMKEVYNGKSPTIHFFLGKKQGYERLVHITEIKRRINTGEEQFASSWRNGTLFKEGRVAQILLRVTGQVRSDCFLADIPGIPDLKIEVNPMYRSQMKSYPEWSRVSFFIGFSMKGPLAFDIETSHM